MEHTSDTGQHGFELDRTPAEASPELTPEELALLFYREIAIDYLPGPAADTPDDERITATLQSAADFEVNGNTVSLRGHQLFLFNALMYLRHQEGGIARKDVFELGLDPNGTPIGRGSIWEASLEYLTKKLNEAAGQDIIYPMRSGRWRRHYIHPGFELDISEDFEHRPEGFYEFSQLINGDLLRLDTPQTVHVGREAPHEIFIRDDETIVINNVATQLNQHDRALLHILTLNQGKPITYDQIFALGFHAYGPPGQAKHSALYRAFHRLDDAMSGDDERRSLFIHVRRGASEIHVLRSFKLTDLRPTDRSKPSLRQLDDDFERLLDLAPKSPGAPSLAEMLPLILDYDRLLTPTEAFTLSLRLGIIIQSRCGTTLTRRKGKGEIAYDDLIRFIIPGNPLPRAFVGELLGGIHDGTVHSSEQYAVHKLRSAEALEALSTSPFSRLLASIERMPPEVRMELYLTGESAMELTALLQRPPTESEAFAAYMLPEAAQRRLNKRDVFNSLVPMRRVYREFAEALETDVQAHSSRFHRKYAKAGAYFLQLLGKPSQDIRNMSFAELAKINPAFAEEGSALMADLLQVLIAFKRAAAS